MSSNLSIYQGDDATLDVTVTNPDDSDSAVDLTGAELWFAIKKQRTDTDDDALLLLKSSGDTPAITIASGTGGTATIAISSTDAAITPGTYYWELASEDASSKHHTLAGGRITVIADLIQGI